jgi:hypothetical protein
MAVSTKLPKPKAQQRLFSFLDSSRAPKEKELIYMRKLYKIIMATKGDGIAEPALYKASPCIDVWTSYFLETMLLNGHIVSRYVRRGWRYYTQKFGPAA